MEKRREREGEKKMREGEALKSSDQQLFPSSSMKHPRGSELSLLLPHTGCFPGWGRDGERGEAAVAAG